MATLIGPVLPPLGHPFWARYRAAKRILLCECPSRHPLRLGAEGWICSLCEKQARALGDA